MKEKTETSQIFKNFHVMVRTQFQMSIQVLKADNARVFFNYVLGPYLLSNGIVHQVLKADSARDFFNYVLGPYLLSNGIVHQSTCVDTPQQNGQA